jgi:tetratricopeptide (TPR) repeat protein
LWRMGAVHIHRGDAARGVQHCNEALALGALPYDAVMAKAVRGYGEAKLGDYDAAIADLTEAVAWFANSRLRYTGLRFVLWLAEAHLCRGDRAAALPLLEHCLATSRELGYRHFEGLASWLVAECLTPEDAAGAERHIAVAIGILEAIGARNDLARAMVAHAGLHHVGGNREAACELLDRAQRIFEALGTLEGPARIEAVRAVL